jgi:hypothetical protein
LLAFSLQHFSRLVAMASQERLPLDRGADSEMSYEEVVEEDETSLGDEDECKENSDECDDDFEDSGFLERVRWVQAERIHRINTVSVLLLPRVDI